MKKSFEYKARLLAEKHGAGAWYRNSDNKEVLIDVSFYPKVQRWITEDGKRRKISKEELEENYHGLRL